MFDNWAEKTAGLFLAFCIGLFILSCAYDTAFEKPLDELFECEEVNVDYYIYGKKEK